MKIYHNNQCSKSNASLKLLTEKGIDLETIEYLKIPLEKAELKSILAKLNIPAKDLIRKGESAFKENYMGKTLSEEEWIEAILSHPILLQRPIIVKGDKAVIGRPIEKVMELLKD